MPASLSLTSVHLRVADLARNADFYTRQLGFVAAHVSPTQVDLTTAPGATPLLTLTTAESAKPAPRDTAGLFHAALLFPTRAALAAR